MKSKKKHDDFQCPTMVHPPHSVRSSLQHFNFYTNYFCLNVSKRLQVQIGSFSHTVEKDEDERDASKSTYTHHISSRESNPDQSKPDFEITSNRIHNNFYI